MAQLQLNTAHRNGIVSASAAIFNAGSLTIRSGSRTGANAAAAGTLLVTITLPNPAFGSPTTGVLDKTGTWQGTAVATGAPGHYRLTDSGATQIREGDAAETPGSGESMILDGLVDGDIVEDGVVTITQYEITQPEGSATP